LLKRDVCSNKKAICKPFNAGGFWKCKQVVLVEMYMHAKVKSISTIVKGYFSQRGASIEIQPRRFKTCGYEKPIVLVQRASHRYWQDLFLVAFFFATAAFIDIAIIYPAYCPKQKTTATK